MTRIGSSHIAPNSAARCDIDLSPGARSDPRSGAGGSKRAFTARATAMPEAAHQPLGLLGHDAAANPQRDRAVASPTTGTAPCPRCRRRTPELERDLGDDPRAVGDQHAQLVHLAARQVGLEQAAAVLAGGVVPLADAVVVAAGELAAHHHQPRDRVVDRRHQRVGVGAVDAAPHAELAPATRVTSRNDGPVAGSRSPSADSTRAVWATSTLASTCGRCDTTPSRRRGCRARSPTARRRAG